MKKKQVIFFLVISAILYYSCRRYAEIDSPIQEKPTNATSSTLNAAKTFFASRTGQILKPQSGSVSLANTPTSISRVEPDWENSQEYKLKNGVKLFVVGMPEVKLTTKEVVRNRKVVFLEANNKVLDGFVVEVYATSKAAKKLNDNILEHLGQTEIPGFTGSLLYFNLRYEFIGSEVLKDGKKINGRAKIQKKNGVNAKSGVNTKAQRGNGSVIMNEGGCIDWYWTTTYYDGYGNVIGYEEQYLYTTCDGGGGGGGGGGGPSTPYYDCTGTLNGTAYNTPCGCIAGTTGIPFCKDPCSEKGTQKMRADDFYNKMNKTSILSVAGLYEWGVEQNANSYPYSFLFNYVQPRSNASTGSFSPIFSWNPTTGYTVGVAHSHPGGTAQSPKDIFWMVQNLTDPDLIASGGINYYKENISVTTYTPDGTTYVVTINDWADVAAKYQTYLNNSTTFNNNYISSANAYMLANGTADVGMAGAWALTDIFGSSINIYKAAPNSTDFVPLQKSGFQLNNKNCP